MAKRKTLPELLKAMTAAFKKRDYVSLFQLMGAAYPLWAPDRWIASGPPIREEHPVPVESAQVGDLVEVNCDIVEDRAPSIGDRIAVFENPSHPGGKCVGIFKLIEVAPKRTQRYRAVKVGNPKARTNGSDLGYAVPEQEYCSNRLFQCWDARDPYQLLMNSKRRRGAPDRREGS